jgi:hypothetical protein
MNVVPIEPQPWHNYRGLWHYLEDAERQYIYVLVDQSPGVSFVLMVELNDDEKADCHPLGWTFLHYFALKLSHWSSKFWERRVSPEVQAAAESAIRAAERHDG